VRLQRPAAHSRKFDRARVLARTACGAGAVRAKARLALRARWTAHPPGSVRV